jgi:hypothetical protein
LRVGGGPVFGIGCSQEGVNRVTKIAGPACHSVDIIIAIVFEFSPEGRGVSIGEENEELFDPLIPR